MTLKDMIWYDDSCHTKRYKYKGREWTNEDTLNVRKYMQENYNVEFSANIIHDAVDWRADKKRYHPQKEYLMSLKGKWDGVKRVETFAIDYFEEEDNAYTREVFKCFLLAAVERVFNPGAKFDSAPIIYGDQGIKKSMFCAALVPDPEWFGELTTFDESRAVEAMSGRWILELAEISVITNKSELEQQKQFMSSQGTKVRLAYRRDPGYFKRQCVFIGTTNRHEYLKDRTGNRRWWPIDCDLSKFSRLGKHLDVDRLKRERDQIWAEVMEMYADIDSTYMLSEKAQHIAAIRQKGKLEGDEWEGIIMEWLDQPASKHRYDKDYDNTSEKFQNLGDKTDLPRERVCIPEIWEDCLKMKTPLKQYDRNRIGGILDNLEGWERKSTARFGDRFGRQRGWVRVFEEAPF